MGGIFDDVPIRYEYSRFRRAGFHDSNHDDLTTYEGRPNAVNNAAWDQLLAGSSSAGISQ